MSNTDPVPGTGALMCSDRLSPPAGIGEMIRQAEERGWRMAQMHFAEIVGLYPLDGFAYDTNNHGELLRLRDTLSEAVLKNVPRGEMIP